MRALSRIIIFTAAAALILLAACPAYPLATDHNGPHRTTGDSSPWFQVAPTTDHADSKQIADDPPKPVQTTRVTDKQGTSRITGDSSPWFQVARATDNAEPHQITGDSSPWFSQGINPQPGHEAGAVEAEPAESDHQDADSIDEDPQSDTADEDAPDTETPSDHVDTTPPMTYEPEPLVVTASRIPVAFDKLTRSVQVIDRETLDTLPVHSLQDVLEYALGVDVRRRGPHGVQGDVSIRGGSFDQTLILVDGFKVSDPQTGHHNLDLPLNLSDIERIEILRGPGSRIYGPGAFSGAINIITRGASGTGAGLGAALGENSFSEGEASVSFPALGIANRLSFGRSESAGYMENTGFAINNLAWNAAIPVGPEKIQLTLGHTEKEFGANGFYSASFPWQWEATETTFFGARGGFDLGGARIEPRVYWRRHDDDFILDRTQPDWYRNLHTTDVYGAEFQSTFESAFGVTAAGGEIGREEIESESLGDHQRSRGGIFVEHRMEAGERLTLAGGAFAYHYSGWGWEIWPGLDAGIILGEHSSLYASVERSFRVPTYTELYYDSPANVGNPDLQPEEAWTWEGGMKWLAGPLEGSAALFRREGQNLIDWTRASEDEPWQVRNVAEMNTNGLEASVALLPRRVRETCPVSRVRASFAYLDPDRAENQLESKYVYNHLERQLIIDLGHDWSFVGPRGGRVSEILGRLNQSWLVRSEDRSGEDSYVLLDTRLAWRASVNRRSMLSRLEFFIEGTNLFGTEYREAGSIPMPGRWIIGGVKVGFGG